MRLALADLDDPPPDHARVDRWSGPAPAEGLARREREVEVELVRGEAGERGPRGRGRGREGRRRLK